MLSLTAFADELEREKARQRTSDAMSRKARAGHLTGGRTFGYDNVNVPGPEGKRSHVVQRINEVQAGVVQRIFELCADGNGLTAIAKRLNAESAASFRAQLGRPNGWAASSVREVLYRTKYKGMITWNQTRKRNRWGEKRQTTRDQAEWLVLPAPELAIISQELWNAAHDRIAADRVRFGKDGDGRIPGHGTKYLLTGLLRCRCGAGIEARTRKQGGRRVLYYGCSAYHRKGKTVCNNRITLQGAVLEATVLRELVDRVLRPAVIDEVVRNAERVWVEEEEPDDPAKLKAELARIDRELKNLLQAVATSGEFRSLHDAIAERESQRTTLRARIQLHETHRPSLEALHEHFPRTCAEWRKTLTDRISLGEASGLLRKLIVCKLECSPAFAADGSGYYVVTGEGTLRGALPHIMASPTGFEPVFWP
jgi:site-specific DNA recombinase